MSLQPTPIEPVPEETARGAQAAFASGNPYLTLRDALGTLYQDDDFTALFPACGQPGLSPWRLALVTMMQFRENLSDRQAAEAVRARLDWKYLLGLELTAPGFDQSVLGEFRARVVSGNAEEMLLDKLLERCRALGWFKARGTQRTDAPHVLAAIRMLNRLESVAATLRAALNTLATEAPQWLRALAPLAWYERYSRRIEDSRLPKSKAERAAYAQTVGEEGFCVLDAVDAPETPQGLGPCRAWRRCARCGRSTTNACQTTGPHGPRARRAGCGSKKGESCPSRPRRSNHRTILRRAIATNGIPRGPGIWSTSPRPVSPTTSICCPTSRPPLSPCTKRSVPSKQGMSRSQVQAGSMTFVQRFGSSLNANLHYHLIFLGGVYLDRSAQNLKPKFVKIAPPSDADIAAVVTTMSQRVIRKLRQLGYLESGIEATVATGHDPLVDEEPELARTLAASVQQRIAFGERAGQKVRRIGSGFGYEGDSPTLTGARCASVHGFSLHANTHIPAHRRDQLERLMRYTARGAVALERLEEDASGDLLYTFTRAWSDGTTRIKLSPVELLEKLAALVPPPRVHQVRYGGCLAAHSKLRGAITPTPRQQGVAEEARPASSHWGWARLLTRVFAIDMARCPRCHQGTVRLIAAITDPPIIRRILTHLKLAADPPPIAPARLSQERFAWASL